MINITHDPRVALEIRRFHTWRCLREQTVGEHSCQIQRIMLTIWPECTRRLLTYAVLHDIDEMVGDLPYPVKHDNPGLRREYDAATAKWRAISEERFGLPPLPVLSQSEEAFFKLCEFLEMWEYGLSEQRMGNEYATMVVERCILRASTMMTAMPRDIQPAIKRYVDNRVKQEDPREQLGEQ